MLAINIELFGNLRGEFRVGSKIRERGMRARARPCASISIIGNVKEAVLPVPV